jgi:hypothetical protein
MLEIILKDRLFGDISTKFNFKRSFFHLVQF